MEEFLVSLFIKEGEKISPYRYSQILGNIAGKKLPPQMIYNYINKNYISAEKGKTQKWEINQKEAVRFAIKYLLKNAPEWVKVNNF